VDKSGHAKQDAVNVNETVEQSEDATDDNVEASCKNGLDSKLTELLATQCAQTNILTDTLKLLVEKESNTYNTTNNNNISINMFMTENCKDAMNMSEFIDSIQVLREDIDKLIVTGNPYNAAQIIGRELSKLAVTKRPMHCTDLKRNTVYIKDDGVWAKEEGDEKLRTLAVRTFRKQAGEYYESMSTRKPGGNTDYWCDRAKHIDEGNFCRNLNSKPVSSRVYNTICSAAILNQSVVQESLKLK
jgi:uncharacterized protein YlaI